MRGPCPFGSPTLLERLDFRPLGGRLSVISDELAKEIGFADVRYLDRWIARRPDIFLGDGPQAITLNVRIGHGRIRKARTYWVDEASVIRIVQECRTDRTELANAQVSWDLLQGLKDANISISDLLHQVNKPS
jgi:hypothetical protein